MAEIHPNDIGLATYTDVGDVANLQTNAKEIVAAINEVLEDSTSSSFGEQLFAEGEDNAVVGSNNVILGNHNRVFGSDNIIIGDGHLVIGSNKTIAKSMGSISLDFIDTSLKRIYLYIDPGDINFHLEPGDLVVINISQSWLDTDWIDMNTVETGNYLTTVTEVNLNNSYISVADMPVSDIPPDEVHIILDYVYPKTFSIIREEYKKAGNGSVIMGNNSDGFNSFSANFGNASDTLSTAVNCGNASGANSFACNTSSSSELNSFSANFAAARQEYAAAFNISKCYGNYSVAFNEALTAGRAIKCTAMSCTAKTLTAANGENLMGLTGNKIIIRYRNNGSSINYAEGTVKSVSGQTIYLTDDTDIGSGFFGEALISDGYIFRVETGYGHNLASGYAAAGGYYTQAHGLYTLAAHTGAVIYGRYGSTPEIYSWSLANGTSLALQGLAVKILQNGDIHTDGTFSSPCADYSELFEWQDGNPNSEDRAGYFVKLIGDKIVKTDEFDTPLGIISAAPAIIGDSGEMHWKEKFITDDFGRIQHHDVFVPALKDKENNIVVEEHYECQSVINPDWDSSQEYIPRLKRPEWVAVGVLGKLVVYDEGILQAGDLCRAGADGKAVKSISSGYPVLKRITGDKVLIWFRG